MKENPYLLVGNPLRNGGFWNSVFFFCILILVPSYLIYKGITNVPFIDLEKFLPGIALSIILIFVAFKKLKRRNIIKIKSSEIVVKNLFEKEKFIERNKLLSFKEIKKQKEVKNGVEKWLELTIYTSDFSFTIFSKDYNNYHALKENLIHGLQNFKEFKESNIPKPIDEMQEHKKELLTQVILVFSLTFVLGIFPFAKPIYKRISNSPISATKINEVKLLSGTVKDNPYKLTPSKSKVDYGVRVELNEFPNFEFEFLKKEFNNEDDYSNLKENVVKGDSLIIFILLDEFKQKISKETSINFISKYFNYNEIKTFGAKYHSMEWKTIYYPNVQKKENIKLQELEENDVFSLGNIVFLYIWIGLFAVLLILSSQKWQEYRVFIEDNFDE